MKPPTFDELMGWTVAELLLLMRHNNAAQYVIEHIEPEAELTLALSVGSKAAPLAAAARELLDNQRGPVAVN